jgi:hypothetical protein
VVIDVFIQSALTIKVLIWSVGVLLAVTAVLTVRHSRSEGWAPLKAVAFRRTLKYVIELISPPANADWS